MAVVPGSPPVRTRPVQQLPEPSRFWIAYAPRRWRSAGGPWTDLANAQLHGFHAAYGVPLPRFDTRDVDDLLYLPPVAAELQAGRDELAAELVAGGTPVLLQLVPGETTAVEEAMAVYDLLGGLLAGDVDRFASLPAGSAAVWPLIAGLSDRPEIWEEGCAVLASRGVACVQGLVVDLSPSVRRKLAESCGDEIFDALFHGKTPSEQELAVVAAELGLEPFVPRRITRSTPRRERNQHVAADLALAGEIWLRLGRPESVGHALFRASRGAEYTHHDLAALVREENLTMMDWLDATSARVVEEIVKTGSSPLVRELLDDYLEREHEMTTAVEIVPPPDEEAEEESPEELPADPVELEEEELDEAELEEEEGLDEVEPADPDLDEIEEEGLDKIDLDDPLPARD